MTTTRTSSNDVIAVNFYRNGRAYANVYLSEPMREADLSEYLEEIHREVFRAINAALAGRGKHIEAPLVRLALFPDSDGFVRSVTFQEWRSDEDDD